MVLGPGSIGETTAPQSGAEFIIYAGPACSVRLRHRRFFLSSLRRGVATMLPGSNHTRGRAFGSVAGEHGQDVANYQSLRDEFTPGKPMWLTETAETACGGNPWASTFLDTFRYLDQFGRLARAGVQMVAHNTLAASDYGLFDEKTLRPRPNYWAALLWRKLMGTIVLDAGMHNGIHLYAHCRRGARGAVTLLAINTDRTAAMTLRLPVSSERYTLSADDMQSAEVKLNGTALELGPNDELSAVYRHQLSPPGSVEIGAAADHVPHGRGCQN